MLDLFVYAIIVGVCGVCPPIGFLLFILYSKLK